MTVIRGTWTLEDRALGPVIPVLFELRAPAVTVRLRYDRSAGVLDLGCEGPGGFRGWSGGARSEYTITPSWATPGYLPGPPEPGAWWVLLGLHRIPPGGLPYELEIVPHHTPPPAPPATGACPPRAPAPGAATRRGLPDLDGMRWLAGDLHAHTVHSDGSLTVRALAELARDQGLDFLAVTDHNTVSHFPELPAAAAATGLILVPGQEVTTDLGHANAFGPIPWVDFRRPPDTWVRAVQEGGGVLSINHPVAGDCAWRHPLTERPRAAEVWHWSWWDRTWGAGLAWAQAWREDVVPLGGSDYHSPGEGHPPGAPTTWVLCEDDDVVGAIAAGRTAVSATPDGPLLLRHGEEFVVRDADGLVLWGPQARSVIRGDNLRLPARPGPHRLETDRNEVMALCG